MLEAVLLAPSTALGHEVVRPPAADRERSSNPAGRRALPPGPPTLVLVPSDKHLLSMPRAILRGLGPEWDSLSKVPWQGVFTWDHGQNVGAWEPLAEVS